MAGGESVAVACAGFRDYKSSAQAKCPRGENLRKWACSSWMLVGSRRLGLGRRQSGCTWSAMDPAILIYRHAHAHGMTRTRASLYNFTAGVSRETLRAPKFLSPDCRLPPYARARSLTPSLLSSLDLSLSLVCVHHVLPARNVP